MKYSKFTMFLTCTVLVVAATIASCNKKSEDPPVAVTPPAVVCEAGYHKVGDACIKDAEVPPACPEKAPGMYTCYDWKPCNGLFPKFEDAVQALNVNDASGCGKIDDAVVKAGFGPCAECFSVKADGSVTPALHTFEELLKIREDLKARGVQTYFQKD